MIRRTPLSSDLAGILELVDRYVDRRVDARLRELGVASLEYSVDSLPSGVSRRTFVETLRSGNVDGAEKDGRVWRCSREAWHRARGRRPVAAPKLRLVERAPDVAELAAETLSAIRGGRR